MVFDPNTGLPVNQPPTGNPPPAPSSVTVNLPPTPPPTSPAPTALSPELQALLDAERERVRQEEKNKLYPQIEELQGQVRTLSQEREERLAAEQAAEQAAAQAAAEEEQRRREEELSARDLIAQRDAEWQQRFEQLEQERQRDQALLEQERRLGQLSTYRAQALAAAGDDIDPRFIDYVRGNTTEEIDQSIDVAKAKTAEIAAELQQVLQGQRRQISMPVSGGPPTDMVGLVQGGERTLTAQEIAAMTPEEYAAIRPQLMAAASQKVQTDGLYAQ